MASHQPPDPPRLAPEGEAERRQLPARRAAGRRRRGDGQVLVRHHFLSLDPYMRGRMNDAKSYAQPQPLDEVMQGGTVGEVVASKHPDYQAGDKVVGFGGWQEYAIVDAGAARRRCARSTPRTCRCRPTSARSACPASRPGTA